MKTIDIAVQSNEFSSQVRDVSLPVELGRQATGEELLTVHELGDKTVRIPVAPIGLLWIPRHALRLEEDDEGGLRVVNIHDQSVIHVGEENAVLRPRESISTSGPVKLKLPQELMLVIKPHQPGATDFSPASDTTLRTIDGDRSTFAMGHDAARLGQLCSDTSEQDAGEVAVSLVRQALTVVQKAAGSNEFFEAAVRATATMIELDCAYVILRSQNRWVVRSTFRADTNTAINFDNNSHAEPLPVGSSRLLENVLYSKKTVIFEPDGSFEAVRASMMILDRAVAAPMLDDTGDVIGVVYGDRKIHPTHANEPIGELEGTLLEVMASAVASGLARQREESLRAAMTQFFSPAVTESLRKDENLLAGRDAEVTVLFCDIRGFSAVSERIGPARTIEWINDVLTELSQCVIQHDGVLVDYIGDELMAMWGAPADQPDHAIRACRAAADMLLRIDPLRQRWNELTPEGFGLGIGINTGIAQVGNTGSKVKFKYGPLGNTVNIASRIQGMTKAFGVTAIIASSTQTALEKGLSTANHSVFHTRRLADARPVGIKSVITLYEFHPNAAPVWTQMCERYEKALHHYNESDLTGAAKELASLVYDHPDDAPSVLLLGRVVEALTQHKSVVDPVMVFHQK
ncbi:adenylate/guanylate cyclase domain-containing protein [Novipirellula artificiosorum]|uniref:Adenylate cyclase 2 n=1 Tax=Novipirellula artificiosorum TaxID=2528016 RepID=A0A5C6DDV9_9BACT|nr:adenylate/guanylate cyclase domain-containing protein [Novipirellula artificiosorum]TWU33406.1 Adenylate cyclase 2 [Novipirellula artificiosorum]